MKGLEIIVYSNIMSLNNYDQFKLFKIIHLHQPNLLLKFESLKDLFERLNFLIEKLGDIYKKYSEPYNLGYHSVNQQVLDLSKLYQFQLCRSGLTTNFSESTSESSKIFILRADHLPEKLSMLNILIFMWFLDLMEKMKPL